MKKRIVNIRFMFVCFCGLMAGILFCVNFFINKNNLLFVLLISLLSLLVIGGFIYGLITEKHNVKHEARKNVSFLVKSSSIGLMVSFIMGVCLTLFPIIQALSVPAYDKTVRVQGVVCDYVEHNAKSTKFIIQDCLIEYEKNTTDCDNKIVVYTEAMADIELGDIVLFEGTLQNYSFFNNSERNKLVQNIGYQTYVNFTNIKVTDGDIVLRDKIKEKTHNILFNNLNEDNAGICYAMIFGQKEGLSDDIQETFSYAGISHILAVSGLHIGVLVSGIYFILKKLKINKYVRLVILTIILVFYCYLCSFTPSVCRASIMAILLSLCGILQIEYDGLSSLSIAGILILIFDPLSIFSLSFQLSFLSVYAIISFAPTITGFFNKFKIPAFLSASLAISIATNIIILPVCANAFTKVSLVGVISNIFVLPLFSATYILVFSIVIISLIFSSLGCLLLIPNIFLHLIKVIADFSTMIDIGVLKTFQNGYMVLFFLCLSVLILHFLMVRRYIKGVIVLGLAAIIITQMITFNVENTFTESTMIFNYQYSSNIVFHAKDDKLTMIGSNIDCNSLLYNLKKLKVRKIDNVIAYDLQLNNLDNLQNIIKECNVDNIYIPVKFKYPEISTLIKNVTYYDKIVDVNDLKLQDIYYKDQTIGIYLNIFEIGDILIPELKPTKAEGKYLTEFCPNVKYYYQPQLSYNVDLEKLNPAYIINHENNSYYALKISEILAINEKEGIYEI